MAFRSHFRPQQTRDYGRFAREDNVGRRELEKEARSTTDEKRQSKTVRHGSQSAESSSTMVTQTAHTSLGRDGREATARPMASTRKPVVPVRTNSVEPTSTSVYIAPLRTSKSQPGQVLQTRTNMNSNDQMPGSTVPVIRSPGANGLRRKPSTISKYAASRRAEVSAIDETRSCPAEYDGNGTRFEDTVLGISLPQTSSYTHHGAYVSTRQDFQSPVDTTTDDQPTTRYITPPVHLYAPSVTPSTRYTDSPFSHVPTPSSASSYSSVPYVATTGSTPRLRQPSPTLHRAPTRSTSGQKVEASRLGLPPVRESSTSSSNSTVKAKERPAPPAKEVQRKPLTVAQTSKPTTSTSSQRQISSGKLTKEKPRQTSNSSTVKPAIRIPPELAHLNVEPSKANLNKALPPIRPSRDGTPVLTGMTSPSPVVQSDLPKVYNTYHKRTPSQESNNPTSPLKSRFGLTTRTPSRQESPRIDSAISPPPMARSFARGPTPDSVSQERPKLARKDSPAVPAPSPSKSPRFGFFSRKPKEISAKPVEKPKRQVTKGPSAGTGHEGYGRFGFRGRSGSSASSNDFRSPSVDSNTSNQPRRPSQGRKSSITSNDSEMEDFLRERLTPVILRGSGSTFGNTTTSSEEPRSEHTSKTSSLESRLYPQLLPSAISDGSGSSPLKQVKPTARAPSESSEDDVRARYATSAARHSITPAVYSDNQRQSRAILTSATSPPSKDSSFDSLDRLPSAPASHNTASSAKAATRANRESVSALPTAHEENEPTKSSRKWNFFQRTHASPKSKGKERADGNSIVMPITMSPAPRNAIQRSTFDPVEPVDLEEVERIVQENETSQEDSMSESYATPTVVPYEARHTGLLPSPPRPSQRLEVTTKDNRDPPRITVQHEHTVSPELMRAQQTVEHHHPQIVDVKRSPVIAQTDTSRLTGVDSDMQQQRDLQTPELTQTALTTPDLQTDDSPQRQPRLSPIGRIPKIVSKRDRDRKLSDSSFSRPFGRTQPKPTVQPPGSLYNQIRELASPIESGSQPVSSTSTRSEANSAEQKSNLSTNALSRSTDRTSIDANGELFAFLPRKDSDVSYTSSSGQPSWILPTVYAPQQEDYWHEYNDLLDDVLPFRTPLSTSSSLGAPFQYASMLDDPSYTPLYASPFPTQPPTGQLPAPPVYGLGFDTTVLSVPQQIARFMQPSMSPLSTPNQLADFVDHYGNRSTSTLTASNRASAAGLRRPSMAYSTASSIPGPARDSMAKASRSSLAGPRASVSSSRHSRSSGHSRSASLPEVTARNSRSSLTPSVRFNRETQLMDIAEVDSDDQAASAHLRFGALMTSKWLSFGRVLFSPADNEMRLADDPKILVVDGLGSDWSFYVALAYPAATVYNLGPMPTKESAWPAVEQQPPSNHRHINHHAISAAFPFPKGFFSTVVFRFPLIATDEAYHSCIFECKRVLRPGGYLEVAVLDLDLNNMGSRAREAVRGLKTRMLQKDPNLSLRNLSDVLVRFIGRRGFEEVQRCIVGVPAAGRIPRSQDISSDSSGTSGKPGWQREDGDNNEVSFADLLDDARSSRIGPGKNNDETITKMVAKVGRWWYTTCYEKALFGTDSASIWNNPALLRECEKQGTSFRLLICHAQKPTQTRRRTVSV